MRVDGQGGQQAQPDGGQERILGAHDAAPRAGIHQAQHARHLELLAQLAHAHAGLLADLVERGEPGAGRVAAVEQVAQEFGVDLCQDHE